MENKTYNKSSSTMARQIPTCHGSEITHWLFLSIFHTNSSSYNRWTVLYAIQCNPNTPIDLTVPELHQYIGIAMYMSIFGLPTCRIYWNTASRVNVVADTMGRNRWETIKRYLHFTDNTKRPANCTDKLYKIRSLIDYNFLQQCAYG